MAVWAVRRELGALDSHSEVDMVKMGKGQYLPEGKIKLTLQVEKVRQR